MAFDRNQPMMKPWPLFFGLLFIFTIIGLGIISYFEPDIIKLQQNNYEHTYLKYKESAEPFILPIIVIEIILFASTYTYYLYRPD